MNNYTDLIWILLKDEKPKHDDYIIYKTDCANCGIGMTNVVEINGEIKFVSTSISQCDECFENCCGQKNSCKFFCAVSLDHVMKHFSKITHWIKYK